MKFVLKLALVAVMFNSCAPNRYLINGDTKTDQKFLVDEIKKAKSNKEISSKTPLIVLDGKPYRYDYELKNETLTLNKKDVASIKALKQDVGVRIYGDFAEDGVLLVTTKSQEAPKKESDENVFGDKNIFVLIDGKEFPQERLSEINPNDIDKITVIKDAEAIKKYTSKVYDGVILIEMKK
ncbi:hypothetical protein [Lacinutrix undariae]